MHVASRVHVEGTSVDDLIGGRGKATLRGCGAFMVSGLLTAPANAPQ